MNRVASLLMQTEDIGPKIVCAWLHRLMQGIVVEPGS